VLDQVTRSWGTAAGPRARCCCCAAGETRPYCLLQQQQVHDGLLQCVNRLLLEHGGWAWAAECVSWLLLLLLLLLPGTPCRACCRAARNCEVAGSCCSRGLVGACKERNLHHDLSKPRGCSVYPVLG
jgi:hypothetical protein